jgi:signal transduction histidine kinase
MKQAATVITLNTKRFELKKTSPVNELKKLLHDIKSPLQTLQIISKGHLDNDKNKKDIEDKCIEKINKLTIKLPSQNSHHICLPNLLTDIKKWKAAELDIALGLSLNLKRPWIMSKISKSELENILSNLINNSVNASKSHRHLKIKASQNIGSTKISILDYGKGINSEQLLTLGQKGSSYTPNGQGIGLNEAIRKIHHIGGEVFCRSLPQIGTQFTITLPY